MEQQTFADGIGRITIIDGIVRMDLIAHSATEADAAGRPKPVFAHRVVMGVDQFLRASQKIVETTHAMAQQQVQRQQPQTTAPQNTADMPAATLPRPAAAAPQPAQAAPPPQAAPPQNRPQAVPAQYRRETVTADMAQSQRPFP